MIVFVIGGSGSGKSEYAENLALKLKEEAVCEYQDGALYEQFEPAPELVYIATMEAADRESRQRVLRHRAMRAGKGFTTREQSTHLEELAVSNHEILLLECLSNLTANEMFSPLGRKERAVEAIERGILHLAKHSRHLIIVGNNVFEDSVDYDGTIQVYIQEMAKIHQFVGSRAERVVEVICGIPVEWRTL